MPSKRIRRTILLLLLLSIIYNLLRANTPWELRKKPDAKNFTLNKTHDINITLEVLGTHIPMPKSFRGKETAFHQVFEPREVGLPKDLKISKPSNETKVILVWTSWNKIKKTINYYFLRPGRKTFTQHSCPNSNCIATFSRKNLPKADAVLFHLIDTKIKDMPPTRKPQQVWIAYNMEPPWQVARHLSSSLKQRLENIFNWTMGYGKNSDLVVNYGFITRINRTRQSITQLEEKSKTAVWFVSDCSTDSKREDYVKELSKHIDIDIYGRCGNNTCFPSQSSACYDEILKNYKFYLSFENAVCEDYVTEKFFNIFNYDIIPVVFGGTKYSEIAPVSSFIDANLYSKPKLLADALIKIAANEQNYNKLLDEKKNFKAFLDPWMCKLCNKLHSPIRNSVLQSVEKWIFQDSHCKRWNKENESYINISQ